MFDTLLLQLVIACAVQVHTDTLSEFEGIGFSGELVFMKLPM